MDRYKAMFEESLRILEEAQKDPDGWNQLSGLDSFREKFGRDDFTQKIHEALSQEVERIENKGRRKK